MPLTFTYIIVEDEYLQQQRLTKSIAKRLNWDATELGVFDNVKEAYQFLTTAEHTTIDILFLDMEFESENDDFEQYDGINLLKSIQEIAENINVVVISGHDIPPSRLGGNIGMIDAYLTKPYELNAFYETVEKLLTLGKVVVMNTLKSTTYTDFNLKVESQMTRRTYHADLVLIEAQGRYQKVYSRQDIIEIKDETFKDLEEKIANPAILQVNRSFIVNCQFVEAFAKNYTFIYVKTVEWQDAIKISIGEGYREKVKNWLNNCPARTTE